MAQASAPILPRWSTRRLIAATLVVLAVAAGFWLLYHFSLVVLILFTAIVLGTAIRPAVDWLQRRGVPSMGGNLVIFLLLLGALAAFVLTLTPLLIEQSLSIIRTLPDTYQNWREVITNSDSQMLRRLGQELPLQWSALFPPTPSLAATSEALTGDVTVPFFQALSYTNIAIWGLFVTVVTLLLSFFWVLEGSRAIQWLILLMPLAWRDEGRELIAAMEEKVGAFVRGQTILCFIIGVLSLIAYWLIGLPYALVLALLAGLFEAVPMIGPILGAIPAVLVALTVEPSLAIWVIVASVIIQQLENNFLVPRVMDQTVGVNAIVTVLAIAAFGSLLGILGAILAIPLAAIIQLLLDRFFIGPTAMEQEKPTGRDPLNFLRYETQALIQDMRKRFREKEVEVEPETDQVEEHIETLATDLDSILAQAAPKEEAPDEAAA
ncbi:MAG: AI-2E family transporter [Anaerolineae bacterium]